MTPARGRDADADAIAPAFGASLAIVLAIAACQPGSSTAPVTPASSAPSAGVEPSGRLATATTGEPPGSEPRPPVVTRRAPIEYAINGKPFPLPIVKGTIAGQPVRMMLDTGANSHIVAGWFMRKAGLVGKKLGEGGTDHAGTAIETFRIDKPNIAIDGWGDTAAGSVVATNVPKEIEKLGIAAFLSPQALATTSDAIVLDLANAELRASPWDDARAALAKKSGWVSFLSSAPRLCEQTSGAIHVLSFVVPVTVEAQKVWLLVDTGAQHSDVFSSSSAGKKLAPRSVPGKEGIFTAAGKTVTRVVEGAELSAGSFTVKTDLDLIPGGADPWCPRDGVVAMDLLRSCTLLLGQGKLEGSCGK